MSSGSIIGTFGIIALACLLGPAIVAGIVLAIIFGVKKHKRNKESK